MLDGKIVQEETKRSVSALLTDLLFDLTLDVMLSAPFNYY
jgi:hypothetical protein